MNPTKNKILIINDTLYFNFLLNLIYTVTISVFVVVTLHFSFNFSPSLLFPQKLIEEMHSYVFFIRVHFSIFF